MLYNEIVDQLDNGLRIDKYLGWRKLNFDVDLDLINNFKGSYIPGDLDELWS